jgi:hypothetical protein
MDPSYFRNVGIYYNGYPVVGVSTNCRGRGTKNKIALLVIPVVGVACWLFGFFHGPSYFRNVGFNYNGYPVVGVRDTL